MEFNSAYEYLSNAKGYCGSQDLSAYQQIYAEDASEEVQATQIYGAYQSLASSDSSDLDFILDRNSEALIKMSIQDASDSSVKNWNMEFQNIVTAAPSPEKYRELSRLAREFASTYGRVIISEMTLAEPTKSIKSVQVGGIAGGRKYIAQGILFKFNLDHMGLYGGDCNAQKAAGHDIKGLMSYSLLEIKGLHFPLMVVINYMGFSLTAMSLLPIGEPGSLKYGSNDCGATMHHDDEECNGLMKLAASKLNLKGHISGFSGSNLMIYGPGDIEVHQGIDKRFYMLDFARVFPPEAKFEYDPVIKGRHLFRLLRPELVRKYKCPLSSDAFSGWSAHDPDRKESARQVKECTTYLWTELIPSFVQRFIEKLESQGESVSRFSCSRLITEMHAEGINVRYLGHIRHILAHSGSLYSFVNQILLTEMISRVVKDDVRRHWRETTKTSRYITEELCKEVLVKILNKVYPQARPDSDKWWSSLKQKLATKFRYSVLENEFIAQFDFRDVFCNLTDKEDGFLSVMNLFYRVCELLGFTFSERGLEDIKGSLKRDTLSSRFQIFSADIKQLDVMVKQTHVIELAEAQYLFYCGLESVSSEANRLLSLAIDKLISSPHVFLFPPTTFISFGKQLSERIRQNKVLKDSKHSLRYIAEQCFEWASFLDQKDFTPILEMGIMLYNCWVNKHERRDFKWEDISAKLKETLIFKPRSLKATLLLSKVYWQNTSQSLTLSKAFALLEDMQLHHPDHPEVLVEHGNVFLAHIFYDLYPEIQTNVNAFLTVIRMIISKYSTALKIDPSVAHLIPIESIISPEEHFLCPRLDNDIQSPINKSAALFTLFYAASKIPLLKQRLLATCPNNINQLSFQDQMLLDDDLLISISNDIFSGEGSNTVEINLSGCSRITDYSLAPFLSKIKNQLEFINISSCRSITNESFDSLLECSKLKHIIAARCQSVHFEHFLSNLSRLAKQNPGFGQLTTLSIAGTSKITNQSLTSFLCTQHDIQHLDIQDCLNVCFSPFELNALPTSLTHLDLSNIGFVPEIHEKEILQKLSLLPKLKIFILKESNFECDENSFTEKIFGLQHPSLEVLISPKGISHYFSGSSQMQLTFNAKIQAQRFTNGNFFWNNESECSSCQMLKDATFKLFRSLEGQHTEGRTIHVNDARYIDIDTNSTHTQVVLSQLNPPVQIGSIKKLEDSRLSVQYFEAQTEVHVVQFASRSVSISLFGSSCTAGPPETTVVTLRPSSHLGITLGILVSLLIEHTTLRAK